MAINYLLSLNDSRLSVRARVCACVALFGGVSTDDIAELLGYKPRTLRELVIPALVRDELIGRLREGHTVRYHKRIEGDRLVRAELLALRAKDLETIAKLRSLPRCKVGLLDEIEATLNGL